MSRVTNESRLELEKIHDLLNHLTAAYLTIRALEVSSLERKEVVQTRQNIEDCIAIAKSCFKPSKPGLFLVQEEVQSIVDNFTYFSKRKKVNLTVICSKNSVAYGDRIMFRRAVSNVLKNAIEAAEFSFEKSVTILVQKKKDSIIVKITDSGKGIDKTIKSKIGKERFSEKATDRGYGMLSAKRIIEKHYSGSISLKNNTGKTGAVCTLTLQTKNLSD